MSDYAKDMERTKRNLDEFGKIVKSLSGTNSYKVVKIVEAPTSGEAAMRANILAANGWVVKHIAFLSWRWFRRERWLVEMYKTVERPDESPSVFLPMNVGPVTQRS